jgi:hypothetical protein
LLAAYLRLKDEGETLEAFLANRVFASDNSSELLPDPQLAKSFEIFIERYKKGFAIERAAIETM